MLRSDLYLQIYLLLLSQTWYQSRRHYTEKRPFRDFLILKLATHKRV